MNPDSLPSFDEWLTKGKQLITIATLTAEIAALANDSDKEAEDYNTQLVNDRANKALSDAVQHLAAHPSAAPQGAQPVQEPVAEHCMCEFCKDGAIHASDCSVHNEPALPIKPCDCHLAHLQPAAWQDPDCPRHVISAEDMRDFTRPVLNGPVTIANAKKHTRPLFAAPQPAPAQSADAAPVPQEVERDAQRYRWLCLMAWGVPRAQGWHELTFRSFGVAKWTGTAKEVADAAIDAAMNAGLTIPATKERTNES